MSKTYNATIKIEFDYSFESRNKKQAISFIKDNFRDDYGLELEDHEIIKLESVKCED